jgi:TonB family protein
MRLIRTLLKRVGSRRRVKSMIKSIGRVTLFLLIQTSCALGQDSPEPRLISAQLPTYPAIARAAHVEGDVKIDFVLSTSGEAVSATPVSGPALLWRAAQENVMSWRFQLPKEVNRTEWSFSTTFHFRITDDGDPYGNGKLTVIENSFRDVQVITNKVSGKFAEHCPHDEEATPPSSINVGDSVKLSRSGCFGTCPAYSVTISENGDVVWEGHAYVASTGVIHSRIAPESARTLIHQFMLPEFWALCGQYSASITDSATTQTQVQIGGRSKTASNYADSAPDWVGTFEDAIDAAADTHLWRHGDPRNEPLSNILDDAWLPKLRVTPLMRAAARADTNSMNAALATGVEVDAQDSSGWTALMYAAAASSSIAVKLLLDAHANPNHQSLKGDTPLLASAISGSFDEDLFRAGADVNAKNSEGVTALMILAAKGQAGDVEEAVRSGADPSAKDRKGRSALDYLRLANCGKSPIIEWQFMSTGGCNYLDEDDVRRVARALTNVKRKTEALKQSP